MRPIWLSFLLSSFLLFASSFGAARAQSTISLHEAIGNGWVEVAAQGLGGYQGKCLEVVIKNLRDIPLNVELWPGTMFASHDDWKQDLIVTAPAKVQLRGKTSGVAQVYTMCTQAWNASPGSGSGFSFNGLAAEGLRKLANRIAKGNYQTSTAQSAVWAISSKEPVSSIYGIDTTATRELAEVVSEETGIPISRFTLTPRPHRIINLNTSIECLLNRNIAHGKLALFNSRGMQVREYFNDRFVEKGFQQFKIGASHTGDSTDTFWLRLMEGENIVSEKKVTITDTILTLPRLHQEGVLGYSLTKATEVEIGLYDEQDRLHMAIAPTRMLEPGFHRSRAIANTPVLPEGRYFIKAKSGNETLASQEVSISDRTPDIHSKRQVAGTWTMQIGQPLGAGRIVLYDQEGRVKRVMAEFQRLNAGERKFSYQFEHVDGPEAVFYLRLVMADGTVLLEKTIGR